MTKTTSEKTHAATAEAVIYGYWGEHPAYPSADWREAVASAETRTGYWDWVADKAEAAQNAEACADLIAELWDYCKAQGLPHLSAEELMHEIFVTDAQRAWLQAFCDRWEAVA